MFKAFCFFGAIVSVSWCCYEYSKNEDICEVYFKRFLEDEESVYPDLTIVLPLQVNASKLEDMLGKNMTPSIFRDILSGEKWDDRILDTQIEDVSLDLDDYMISHCVWSSIFQPCFQLDNIITSSYMGQVQITIRFPPKKQVMSSVFQFSTSVFSNGLNPEPFDLIVAFQYPNRLYRAQGSFFDVHWTSLTDKEPENWKAEFALKNMEVLRRRDKRGRKCFNLENYDESMKENIYIETGCRPYYINSSSVDKICDTQQKIQEHAVRTQALFYRLPGADIDQPPCTEIQKLQIDYSLKTTNKTTLEEHAPSSSLVQEHPKTNGTWFEIAFDIQTDTFKEIKQKRAYSEQSLVGNIGGYLGIFIGFSLLDLFASIISLRIKMSNKEEKLFSAPSDSRRIHMTAMKDKLSKCDSCKKRGRFISRTQYHRRSLDYS